MSFRIEGIPAKPFAHLFGLADEELAERGARRYVADTKPGFPCRVTLEDAELGEPVLLVNFVHLDVRTPFRASHAVYVREGATESATFANRIPDSLRRRNLSVRAFDAGDMMTDADLVDGNDLERVIDRFFASDATAYLHAHYAERGCFAARIDRA